MGGIAVPQCPAPIESTAKTIRPLFLFCDMAFLTIVCLRESWRVVLQDLRGVIWENSPRPAKGIDTWRFSEISRHGVRSYWALPVTLAMTWPGATSPGHGNAHAISNTHLLGAPYD